MTEIEFQIAEGTGVQIGGVDFTDHLVELNTAQRAAVEFGTNRSVNTSGSPPLLIIAGAGTGKTKTLAARVAHLILCGADPNRVLLLTFTRRAAEQMTRRAQSIVAGVVASVSASGSFLLEWSGTFHGIASRLLRIHAAQIGLNSAFTIMDRSDSADLLDLVRNDLGFSEPALRFPKKGTCLKIYSYVTNTQQSLEVSLRDCFPSCDSWITELNALFRAYVETKQKRNLLDYDDLLLHWKFLMEDPNLSASVRSRFDHVLVDEYQDTNALQAAILLGLKPDGRGLTVVGDEAQSIFSFRGATVRNILDFHRKFDPEAQIITLEQNYRSTQPILDACNAVLSLSCEGFKKELFSERLSALKPTFVMAEEEKDEVEFVITRILENRESGLEFQQQAVLFRASHHSSRLEIELGLRGIPFVKHGGTKFLESAHVKDLLSVLRWVENPRDSIAAFRALQLLPGIGPQHAKKAYTHVEQHNHDLATLHRYRVGSATAQDWPLFCDLLITLRKNWHGQVGAVRKWYQPILEGKYDGVPHRINDLEQLEQISASYSSRGQFLSDLTLEPLSATEVQRAQPADDDDYLVLSTIHSAKGQEWNAVYVLHVTDGCIPSHRALETPEELEEELRLLYVAMTRARDQLHLIHPLRSYKHQSNKWGDSWTSSSRSRFFPDSILGLFKQEAHGRKRLQDQLEDAECSGAVARRLRDMWPVG
jgi:DNA helicase-2/ATP-dependent DNA helicase PcrA